MPSVRARAAAGRARGPRWAGSAAVALLSWLEEAVPDDDTRAALVLYDGFDEAVLGVVERFGQPPIVLYDRDAVLAEFMADGCSYEEAVEYFAFTVIGGWVGATTPAFGAVRPRPPRRQR